MPKKVSYGRCLAVLRLFSPRIRFVRQFLHPFLTRFPGIVGILCAGLALLIGTLLAIVPWIMALIRDLGTERALKEREEERADMTAHLHDGVLQTLALIQLHADDHAAGVFARTLAGTRIA